MYFTRPRNVDPDAPAATPIVPTHAFVSPPMQRWEQPAAVGRTIMIPVFGAQF
jgi:hypothetical protein